MNRRGRVVVTVLAVSVIASLALTSCSRVPVEPAASASAPAVPSSPRSTSSEPGPETDEPPVVAAAGDIACEPGAAVGRECQHKAVSEAILADTAVSVVLALGDNQYPQGAAAGFRSAYDRSWGRFKNRTRPVPGNHEYETPGAAGYFDYFGALAGERGKGYYSYDVGPWHFIALNSEFDLGRTGAQVAWLKADLRAHHSSCVAAYWHRPRWSSGTVVGDYPTVTAFMETLYDANADLVLVGHEHNYERFQPLNPDGERDDHRGIVQIVSGLGGKSQFPVRGRATTAAKNSTAYGYTRLVLHPDSADITFEAAVGDYHDAFTLPCH